MNYEQEMKKVNKLIEQRKDISNQLNKQKDMVIDAIDITLRKRIPEEIDIDNDISIRVYDASIEIGIYRNNIPTEIISILENILGNGEIQVVDDEFYIYFKY